MSDGAPVDLEKTVQALMLRVSELEKSVKSADDEDKADLRAELALLRQELADLRAKAIPVPPAAPEVPAQPRKRSVDDEIWGN